MVQNFREIAENPMIENFRNKNFVFITFFHDLIPLRRSTCHIVAPPTIEEKRARQDLYESLQRGC